MRTHYLTVVRSSNPIGSWSGYFSSTDHGSLVTKRTSRLSIWRMNKSPLPITTDVVYGRIRTAYAGIRSANGVRLNNCQHISLCGTVSDEYEPYISSRYWLKYEPAQRSEYQINCWSDTLENWTVKSYQRGDVIYVQLEADDLIDVRVFDVSTMRRVRFSKNNPSEADRTAIVSKAEPYLEGIGKKEGNQFRFQSFSNFPTLTKSREAQAPEFYQDWLSRYDFEGFNLRALNVRSQTLSRNMGKCLTAMEEVNTSLFLAENVLEGTIVDALPQLFQYAKRIGGTKGRSLARSLSTFSKLYLTYNFGVKAPMHDLAAYANVMSSMKEAYNYGPTAACDFANWQSRLSLLLQPSEELDSYLKLIQLGIEPGSLLTTGWELLPYSFIVDWFLPIQQLVVAGSNSLRYDRLLAYIRGAWSTVILEDSVPIDDRISLRYYDRMWFPGDALPRQILPLTVDDWRFKLTNRKLATGMALFLSRT